MSNRIIAFVCYITVFIHLSQPVPAMAAPLTLEDAVARAVANDPQLQSEKFSGDAARARVRQADTRPNPELSVEVENFAGTGGQRGFAGSEVTLGVAQKLELGGKREARVAAAQRMTETADWALEEIRREIIANAATAYVEAAFADGERQALTAQIADLARIITLLKRRTAEGAAPLADVTRAEIDQARAKVDLASATSAGVAKRARLAALIGIDPSALHLKGIADTSSKNSAIDFAALEVGLSQHPRVLKLLSQQRESEARVRLEASQATPDVTLGLGVRRRQETDDTGFLVSASMPIPVFDRNDGNIDAAKAELARSGAELDVARRKLTQDLQSQYAELISSCTRARQLTDDVRPASLRVVKETQNGFSRGRLNALVLLDAHKAKAAAEVDAARALTDCERAKAAISVLTGIDPQSGAGASLIVRPRN